MHTYNIRKILALIFSIITLILNSDLPSFAQGHSVSINQKNGKNKTQIEYKDGRTNFSIEYEGEIVLSEDDKDVLSIS